MFKCRFGFRTRGHKSSQIRYIPAVHPVSGDIWLDRFYRSSISLKNPRWHCCFYHQKLLNSENNNQYTRMRRFLKPALIVLLICSCLTAKGQEKEFREAINKGKGVTGYYRADLSASHITLKKLTDYALKMKYVLRNPRLGSGRQE